MRLTDTEKAMRDGAQGEARRRAMDGLIQLGEAYGAEDMVEIGYAHIHAGMAMYRGDVELMEDLAAIGARVAVPSTSNIANADMVNWRSDGTPEPLARLQRRAEAAHAKMGSACTFTCTPYHTGVMPAWNMHMTSIESTVTIFCNSVIGARSNRDGFFAVYAALTGRYPRFGYHLDENRIGTHLVRVEAPLDGASDWSAAAFAIGRQVGSGVPVITGLPKRPGLIEFDAIGSSLATSGGVSLFIIPGVTPPYADAIQAFAGRMPKDGVIIRKADVAGVYAEFGGVEGEAVDLVHVGCPHATHDKIREVVDLLAGRRIHGSTRLWVTTSRAVRDLAARSGYVTAIERAGGIVIADTCPMSCHIARTTSPDPSLGFMPTPVGTLVVDSAKQAKYVRDVVQCRTWLTGTAEAVETAVSGRFVGRRAA